MTAIAKRKPRTYPGHIINRIDPAIWKENKKPILRWADNEAARKGYKPQVTNLLKTLVILTNTKLKTIATIPTIIKKLNSQFPNSTKCPRTIHRHLAILEKGKSIKRGEQLGYNSPCPTKVLATKLVNSSATECHTKLLRSKRSPHIAKASPCMMPSQDNFSFYDEEYEQRLAKLIAKEIAAGNIM